MQPSDVRDQAKRDTNIRLDEPAPRRAERAPEATISWSDLYRHRRAAAARLGKIENLPIVRRVREVLCELVRDRDRVLEVGAGDRKMKTMLEQAGRRVEYRSLDIDPHGQHDYRSFDEINEPFDGAFAFEVIEHLPADAIHGWLGQLYSVVRPGGWLVLSTPNIYYPPAYLRDVTHRTPLCYDELAGLAAAAGFDVERVVRIYHDPVHRKLMRRYLFGWLFRMLGFDFARQIVLVARRPSAAS